MRLRLAGAATAVVLAAVCFVLIDGAGASSARVAASSSCGQRANVIGARGSGDPQSSDIATDKYGDTVHGMGKPGAAFAVALANRLPRGQVTFLPVIYPAAGLLGDLRKVGTWGKFINAIGSGAHVGFLGAYTGSVNDGKRILRQEVADEERLCPSIKLVLVGYSQGAQVVADVYGRDLTATQRQRIIGVVVFGDPYFNPADNAADQSSYGPTRHGVLGTRAVYPETPSGHVFSICHSHDPICQGPGRITFSQHGNYQIDPWINTTAANIAARLKPQTSGGSGIVTPDGVIGGHLRLDRSTESDVRSFAGPPAVVVSGTLQAPSDPTYTAFGYDCSTAPSYGFDPGAYQPSGNHCRTIYYFSSRTGALSAFLTTSPAFHTGAGTRPGMPQSQADRLEGRHATGSARPAISFHTSAATLDLDNGGGHPVSISPTAPYRWIGGTVKDFALESASNPVGLLFV